MFITYFFVLLYLVVALAASYNKPKPVINQVKPVDIAEIKPNIVMENKVKNVVKTKFRQLKGIKRSNSTSSTAIAIENIDYSTIKPPAIVVDGYNVIGYLTRQNSIDSLEDARDELIADLRVLAGTSGWFIEVVFDAYKATSFNRFSTASKTPYDGIKVTYTSASETADNYIENRFNQLKMNNFTNMVVATDDNLLRVVAGSMGSGYLSCEILIEEIKSSYNMWENMQLQMSNIERTRFNNMTVENMLNDEIKEVYRTMKKHEMRTAGVMVEERNNKNEKIKQEKELKKQNRRETVTLLQGLIDNSTVTVPAAASNKTDKYYMKNKPTLGGLLSTSMKAAIVEQMKREEELQKMKREVECKEVHSTACIDDTKASENSSQKTVETLLQQKQEIETRLAMLKLTNSAESSTTIKDNKQSKKKGKQAEIRFR